MQPSSENRRASRHLENHPRPSTSYIIRTGVGRQNVPPASVPKHQVMRLRLDTTSTSAPLQPISAKNTKLNFPVKSSAKPLMSVATNKRSSKTREDLKLTGTAMKTSAIDVAAKIKKMADRKMSALKEVTSLPSNIIQKRSIAVQTDTGRPIAAQMDTRTSIAVQTDTSVWQPNDSYNVNISFTCPICFNYCDGNASSKENMGITCVGKCGHCFCQQCSLSSYAKNAKCPMCQRKLVLKDFHPIYLS